MDNKVKKNIELVKQESAKLYQEIINNGYTEALAKQISDDLATKGGYLFNKSHSYSYSVLCLQTAYLKCHHPTHFFSSLFNMNKNKPGMINKHIIDARHFNINILPPNINKSKMNFSVYDNSILFGLSAITGIGENIAGVLIDERSANGKFKDFADLNARVTLSKKQIVSLIKSGAIPTKDKKKFLINYFKSQYETKEYQPVSSLPTKIKLLTEWDINVDDYKVGKKVDKDAVLQLYNTKKAAIFKQEQEERYRKYIEECNEKYLQDEQYWEFETLEFFVSDENPFEQAYDILPDFDDVPIGEDCVVVGIISKIQKKKTKRGDQFAFINIYGTTLVEGTVWPDALKKFQDLIVKGTQVAIACRKEADDKVVVNKMKSYQQWLKDTNHLRK